MRSLEQLLDTSRVELPNWPTDEANLDRFLLEFENETSPGNSTPPANPGVLLRMKVGAGKTNLAAWSVQRVLFDLGSDESPAASSSSRGECFSSIVREAYLEVYDGDSIDRVIADPEKNSLFIHACWKLGAQAAQADLNRQLLNARKSKKIGKVPGVQRYVVSREQMEPYYLATEASLRILQDSIYSKIRKWVSLDDIVCDPRLGKQFVEHARLFAPGFKAFDYRWAALSIRKGLNRISSEAKQGHIARFTRLGCRSQFKASQLPSDAGLFWITTGGSDCYIGHAANVRKQLELLIDTGVEEHVTKYHARPLFDDQAVCFAIAPLAGSSVSVRDPIKRELVAAVKPRMNVIGSPEHRCA